MSQPKPNTRFEIRTGDQYKSTLMPVSYMPRSSKWNKLAFNPKEHLWERSNSKAAARRLKQETKMLDSVK